MRNILTHVILLFCVSFKGSHEQNTSSSKRWLFQMISPDANNPLSTDMVNQQRNIFSSFAFAKPPPNYLVKKSPLPLINFGKKHYYVVDSFKANFIRAYQFCKAHNMELLRIESKAEDVFFAEYLANAKINTVWLGGSDLAEEGKFVWLSTGKKVIYSSFADKQPDNAGNNEHCLEFSKWNEKYVWNDIGCNATPNFICQVSTCNDFCVDVE